MQVGLRRTSPRTSSRRRASGPRSAFARALDKRKVDVALEWRLELTEIIGAISRRFIDVPASEFRSSIDDALQRISTLCGFRRAGLYEAGGEDRINLVLTHRFLAPGEEAVRPLGVIDSLANYRYIAAK